MDGDGDFRISMAGAQEKTALLLVGAQWCRPHHAPPTTPILKPPIGGTPGRQLDLQPSPKKEGLCSRILNAFGLPVGNCHAERFGSRKALVVDRPRLAGAPLLARIFHRTPRNEDGIALVCPKTEVSNLDQTSGQCRIQTVSKSRWPHRGLVRSDPHRCASLWRQPSATSKIVGCVTRLKTFQGQINMSILNWSVLTL